MTRSFGAMFTPFLSIAILMVVVTVVGCRAQYSLELSVPSGSQQSACLPCGCRSTATCSALHRGTTTRPSLAIWSRASITTLAKCSASVPIRCSRFSPRPVLCGQCRHDGLAQLALVSAQCGAAAGGNPSPETLPGKAHRVPTRTLRERSSDLGSFLIESLLGMRLIVASGNEGHEAERFGRLNANFVQSMLSMQLTSFSGQRPAVAPSWRFRRPGVFLRRQVGDRRPSHSRRPGGLYGLPYAIAFRRWQSLLAIYTNLLTGGVALRRVFEVLDAPVEVHESPHALALEDVRGAIDFDHVYFRYSENVPVIDQVSFHVPAGALCVVVGSSGAGKSPWLTCCCVSTTRNREPSGSTDTTCAIFSFKTCAGILPWWSKPLTSFERGVRENIAYGRPDASLEKIRGCCKAAAIDDFIQSLPDRYETHAGRTRFDPVRRRTPTHRPGSCAPSRPRLF